MVETRCIGERFEHSQTLIPHAEQLVESHGMNFSDLDLICVSQGPGSFTGLRVGLACAKGLAMGLEIPVVGVSTFEVLLAGFVRDFSPLPSRVHLLLDAKKGEFFTQLWRPPLREKKTAWIPQPPKVLPEDQISWALGANSILVSPQLSKLRGLLAEHVIARSAATKQSRSNPVEIHYDSKDRFPDAADLATLGLEKFLHQKRGDADLQPVYLRKTDAELLFKNKPRSVFRWERSASA